MLLIFLSVLQSRSPPEPSSHHSPPPCIVTPSLTVNATELVSADGGTVDEEGMLHTERPASHQRLSNCKGFSPRGSDCSDMDT